MDFDYITEFEIDIDRLIEAIRAVDIITSDGEEVREELLSKLFNI